MTVEHMTRTQADGPRTPEQHGPSLQEQHDPVPPEPRSPSIQESRSPSVQEQRSPSVQEPRGPWFPEECGTQIPQQRGPAEERSTRADVAAATITAHQTLLGGARQPGQVESADEAPLAEVVQLRTPAAPTRPRRRWRRGLPDAGMATAEYAVVLLAAVGFAGLLIVILTSAEVREALTGLVRGALSV
ncbi:DUF4244 domain-containing protein [Cellulomonas denverensis]|uniref:DUF4244 domain-containing protein n=1 Tax=Cellulomonas denverensis TaxID=264297 RepID=UPI0035E863C8